MTFSRTVYRKMHRPCRTARKWMIGDNERAGLFASRIRSLLGGLVAETWTDRMSTDAEIAGSEAFSAAWLLRHYRASSRKTGTVRATRIRSLLGGLVAETCLRCVEYRTAGQDQKPSRRLGC
jgi:hypothetical protein